jgi:hypothetical protein
MPPGCGLGGTCGSSRGALPGSVIPRSVMSSGGAGRRAALPRRISR